LESNEDNQGKTALMDELPDWIRMARQQWKWQGQTRPTFATPPGSGQVSVWDFPRPPLLVQDTREVVVHWGEVEVARTHRAVLVLETSHPPSVYLPWDDVAKHLLEASGGGSFCEWKGPATYWRLVSGESRLPRVAWSYPKPLASAEILADCVAFYPANLNCQIDGARVRPQPGGFYGGWITPELVGPFKGEPGSEHW
jgi:uncharacterized protein (DUF427 family)